MDVDELRSSLRNLPSWVHVLHNVGSRYFQIRSRAFANSDTQKHSYIRTNEPAEKALDDEGN